MLANFMLPTIKRQQKDGHYVCVCISEKSEFCIGDSESYALKILKDTNLDVFFHGLDRTHSPVSICCSILRTKKVIKKNKIDIVICHSVLGSIVGRLAAWMAGIKHRIYFCHGLACAQGQSKISWLFKFSIERFMAFFTTGMLVMNNYDQDLAIRWNFINNGKLFRIPGIGINLNNFQLDKTREIKKKVYNELMVPEESILTICVARLISEKGVSYYIEAAKIISREKENAQFILVGDGPLMQQLKMSINDNYYKGKIKFLGWRQDVPELLMASDIFVLPSYYPEGLSVAIIEAMASAKAVITTNNRGCIDSVDNKKNGIIVPMRNLNSLVNSLRRLLEDEALRLALGRNARDYTEKNCTSSHCTAQIISALEGCIAERTNVTK